MNKEIYIDIIEKALSRYGDERIDAYTQSVREKGLTEHGFPRLTAAMGILLAFGRGEKYRERFLKNMDFCCEKIPVSPKAANNFSVREVCLCIELLREKKTVAPERLEKWIADLRTLVPQEAYQAIAKTAESKPNNWAVYAAVSEMDRDRLSGVDTSDFIELQLGTQLAWLDENGMYRDPDCPLVYDAVPRMLYDLAFHCGYRGASLPAMQEKLNGAADFTIRMQSVTGEFPFGGRSNQCMFNEMLTAADCEYHAARLANENPEKAGQFKAAAALSCRNLLHSFAVYPFHVKNRYPADSFFGCEKYAYFDKYMITTASFAYLAYLLAEDDIPAAALPTVDAFSLSADFHKTFARGFGWFLEFDTDADLHYDATGLGRIHREGCPETIALSVPFPCGESSYRTEHPNPRPMSLCAFAVENGEPVYGSCVPCGDVETEVCGDSVTVRLMQQLGGAALRQEYCISAEKLRIRHSGGKNSGFCLPLLDFDGEKHSVISVGEGCIAAEYEGCVCRYSFTGSIRSREYYENRSGRYCVFEVLTDAVTVEIERL